MWPEPLLSLWGWSINLYVIMLALGALAALELGLYLGWERGFSPFLCLAYWLAGLGGFALGGGILPELIQGIQPGQGRWSPPWVYSILIAELLLVASRRSWRTRAPVMMDIVSPAVALGQAIGKLGCFAAGCCHGFPAPDLPWAVTFAGGLSAARYPGLPLHPVQLYESLGCFFITVLLLRLRRHPSWQGQLGWLFLVSYGLLRFVVEFFRGDPRPMVGLLSLNQVICLGFIAIGGAFLLRSARARAKPANQPLAPLARSAD
jgi:phosphatidylglycerol:prolipoprotein diacylglycerol transferase